MERQMGGRYEVLDGLRGAAALLVVGFHLGLYLWPGGAVDEPLHHGYLAVDFFFMLSGFVIAYAYDRRWTRMTLSGFFTRRLVRLHPLVLVGVGLGALSYIVGQHLIMGDPLWPRRFLGNIVFGALLLPAPGLPGAFDHTHPLNPPSWSLTQEYLANVAYALVGLRLRLWHLRLILALSGFALVAIGLDHDSLNVGVNWDTAWLAPVRTVFPFFAGIYLQRAGVRVGAPGGWLALCAGLAAIFAAPWLPTIGGVKTNGLYEAAVVLLVFPLMIAAGATGATKGLSGRLCQLSGEISYPLYIIHIPFVSLFGVWLYVAHPARAVAFGWAAVTWAVLPLVAWSMLKTYDEPVRRWLSQRLDLRGQTPGGASEPYPAAREPGPGAPETLG